MPRNKKPTRYPDRVRRIERLINLIAALLETDRPMTADEIRENIAGYDQEGHQAFRRAFERDKQSLRTMGIPLELVNSGRDVFSDQADAYIIPKDRYYLPELDLEPDELAALRLAADAVLGASDDAASGLMKLSLDSTTSPWSGPRVVWGADVAAEQPLLGPLFTCVLERSTMTFDYETADGTASTRTLEPYQLAHRRGNWYVVGRDIDRDAVRSFRLTRIRSEVTPTGASFKVPEGFDVKDYIGGEAFEIGGEEAVTVQVRFSSHLRWWAEQMAPDATKSEAPDGALDVEMKVVNIDALVSWAIGFGDDIEIVGPQEARSAVVEQLQPFLEGAS